jgi:hypothetical protein
VFLKTFSESTFRGYVVAVTGKEASGALLIREKKIKFATGIFGDGADQPIRDGTSDRSRQ